MPDTPKLGELEGLEAVHPSSDCQKFPSLLYINHFLKLPHKGPVRVPGEPFRNGHVLHLLLPPPSWF